MAAINYSHADVFEDIINQLKNGNATGVAKYFNQSIELTILETEGVYSKQQAEMMLRRFINSNQPKNVALQHKGASSKGAMYAIAIYESSGGRYRTYIFMKDSGNGMMINELRIERD